MSITSILKASCPDVFYDRQLTPAELEAHKINEEQAALYSQNEIRDAYVNEEVKALKKEVQEESIYILEQDSDYEPIDQIDIEP